MLVIHPRLAFGLMIRGVGLTYFVVFFSLLVQTSSLISSRGVQPLSVRLLQLRQDFPIEYWSKFPTVFWITGCNDFILTSLLATGMCLSSLVFLGYHTRLCLLTCWLILHSFSMPFRLVTAWDSLLFEVGFLTVFFPPLQPLFAGTCHMTSMPHPLIVLCVRWLLFRCLLGFGKLKFEASVTCLLHHSCYIKHFLIFLPSPNPAGCLLHHAPLIVFQLGMLFMFSVECIAPFLLFAHGLLRTSSFCSICILMNGIQLTGNFGHFQLLVCVLAIGVAAQSEFELPPVTLSELLTKAATLLYIFCTIPFLQLLNSYDSDWPRWASLNRQRYQTTLLGIVMDKLFLLCRWCAICRLVHGYGAFYPKSRPPIRPAIFFELSTDEKHWYKTGTVDSIGVMNTPRFSAPHMRRFEFWISQESYGKIEGGWGLEMRAGMGLWPYVSEGLLAAAADFLTCSPEDAAAIFHIPHEFRVSLRRHVRVHLFALRPTTLSLCVQGIWWYEQAAHENILLRSLPATPACLYDSLSIHPEWFFAWKSSSPQLARLWQSFVKRTHPSTPQTMLDLASDILMDHKKILLRADFSIREMASKFCDEFIPFAKQFKEKLALTQFREKIALTEYAKVTAEMRRRWSHAELNAFKAAWSGITFGLCKFMDEKQCSPRQSLFDDVLTASHIIAEQKFEPGDWKMYAKEYSPNVSDFCFIALLWDESLTCQIRAFEWFVRPQLDFRHPHVSHAPTASAFRPCFGKWLPLLSNAMTASPERPRPPCYIPPALLQDWVERSS